MQFILLLIVLVLLLGGFKAGFRFLNALVGFESFGGKFNLGLMVASWGLVGLIYLLSLL